MFNVIREDIQSDLHQNLVARMLLTMMNQHFREDHADTYWGARATRRGGVEVAIFPGEAFGWGPPYDELHVVFGPVQGRSRGGSSKFQDGTPFIQLDFFLDPQDIPDCIRALNEPYCQTTILHELIHFLDSFRNPHVHDQKDYQENAVYYNASEEYNAFFHNIADGILHFIQVAQRGASAADLGRMARLAGLDASFTRTISGLIERHHQDEAVQGFITHLNDRNNRALLKRLYKLHQAALPYLACVRP